MTNPGLATGIGLRAPHLPRLAAGDVHPPVAWLEAHAENYLGGGPVRRHLLAARARWPLALHAVGLSLGGADGVDDQHLGRVADLVTQAEPFLVSDHLSWSGFGGRCLNDLLPLPYTEEALAVVTANVDRVQSRLRRSILVENPSTYLRFAESAIPEAEFLVALARRSGCRLLLDVNNLDVNRHNHGDDPLAFVAALPVDLVAEIHLAGHSVNDADGVPVAIDDHGSAVGARTWTLFAAATRRFPGAPALIEWDSNIPTLELLQAEALQADRRRAAVTASDARAA